MVPVEEGGIYFTAYDNSTPDTQPNYNPVALGRFVVSSRFPSVEPRTVLCKGICSSNRRQWID